MGGSFQIHIGGGTLDDFSKGTIIDQVVVQQELNQHWSCAIQLRQTEDQRFPFEDAIGKPLEATAVDESGESTRLFTGFVLEAELDYELFGSYRVRLVGVTQSYKMDLTPRLAYYSSATMASIARKLTALSGLDVEGALNSSTTFNYLQAGETDFSFLKRGADDFETWVRPSPEGIFFGNSFQPGETLHWRAERGLFRFRANGKLVQPSFSGAHYHATPMQSRIYEKVSDTPELHGSMVKLAEAIKMQSAQLPPNYLPHRYRSGSLEDYERRLKKETRRALGNSVNCWGASHNAKLKPGDKVTIQGVLDATGVYGLTKVTHKWIAAGYSNEFTCTLAAKYTTPAMPAPPTWPGLMPARVVDNHEPSGTGAIKIQFYWQEDGPTTWMRMMTPHAGQDRGFYFLPEIGDEVWVFFEDGDPERLRVLGAAWNGIDKPPVEAFWGDDIASNDVKRIVTKSGHRISLVDKPGKESISLSTPQHVRVLLTESSNESGTATLSLHSDGDVVISAGGRIHLRSSTYTREIGGEDALIE